MGIVHFSAQHDGDRQRQPERQEKLEGSNCVALQLRLESDGTNPRSHISVQSLPCAINAPSTHGTLGASGTLLGAMQGWPRQRYLPGWTWEELKGKQQQQQQQQQEEGSVMFLLLYDLHGCPYGYIMIYHDTSTINPICSSAFAQPEISQPSAKLRGRGQATTLALQQRNILGKSRKLIKNSPTILFYQHKLVGFIPHVFAAWRTILKSPFTEGCPNVPVKNAHRLKISSHMFSWLPKIHQIYQITHDCWWNPSRDGAGG